MEEPAGWMCPMGREMNWKRGHQGGRSEEAAMICEISRTEKAAPLFAGWEETMIASCLQGVMGKVYGDSAETPASAMALLGDFCQEYHYSLQYVSRKFKQETGFTASEYLQKKRLEKSCELLICSDMSIQEIAHQIGYEDTRFFNQLFQKKLKMSPREYRKMSVNTEMA